MMEGVNSTRIYLIHYKNFCKCHNAPPPSTTIKRKKEPGQGTMSSQECILAWDWGLGPCICFTM
jgi:hypothetical protein